MPTKTTIQVIAQAGATLTSFRISAPIRPDSSATPTPIMATRITATTLKLEKLLTREVNRNRMPSTDSRLWMAVVSVRIATSSGSGRVPGHLGTALDLVGDPLGSLGHLVGDGDVEGGQDRGQHDDQDAEPEEDDRRVGDLVADALDDLEQVSSSASSLVPAWWPWRRTPRAGGVSVVRSSSVSAPER